MDTKIKVINLNEYDAEARINTFLASGVQLMADGITYLANHVTFLYREEGVVGMPLHTKLNLINNEIQNAQKKILADYGTIDEAQVRIDQYEGTEEGKEMLVKQKEQAEASLKTTKLILVKLISMHDAVKSGAIVI